MFDRQQENTHPKNLTVGERVDLPSVYGTFKLIPFQDKVNGLEHIALIKGDPQPNQSTLVRIHSACATGDLFGSLRCDCGPQLHQALRQIEQAGRGGFNLPSTGRSRNWANGKNQSLQTPGARF